MTIFKELYNKYNTKISIWQYIYKYMRKRLIVEDEVKQLNDFQKILLLNIKKDPFKWMIFFNSWVFWIIFGLKLIGFGFSVSK